MDFFNLQVTMSRSASTEDISTTTQPSFVFTGVFKDKESLVEERPQMIAHLDSARDLLEEISADLGVTDPVSGPVLVEKLNWCT